MNRLHDFSLLSSNSFLHPSLKSKFTKKNSLTSKKFHFRKPIFNKQQNITKVIQIIDRELVGIVVRPLDIRADPREFDPHHDTLF